MVQTIRRWNFCLKIKHDSKTEEIKRILHSHHPDIQFTLEEEEEEERKLPFSDVLVERNNSVSEASIFRKAK